MQGGLSSTLLLPSCQKVASRTPILPFYAKRYFSSVRKERPLSKNIVAVNAYRSNNQKQTQDILEEIHNSTWVKNNAVFSVNHHKVTLLRKSLHH